jgi:hypothetical protein
MEHRFTTVLCDTHLLAFKYFHIKCAVFDIQCQLLLTQNERLPSEGNVARRLTFQLVA